MPAASLREEGPQRREQCLNIDFVFVAVVAFVVPWRAYRLQDYTQDSSDEQEFTDLIEKLQEQLAKLVKPDGAEITLENSPADNAALMAARGLALEARKRAVKADLKPDWFQAVVLATAFSEVWDLALASEYWDDAVAGAKTHQSRIRCLMARAQFYSCVA